VRATEPLPAPPAQSKPFTAKAQRSTTELSRSGEVSERRGPITAVFAPEDFDDDQQVSATSKTEPLESRSTKPINPQNSTSTLAPEPSASKGGGSTQVADKTQSNSTDRHTRRNLIILGGLMLLGIGGLVIGATTYLKQQAEARDAQQQAEKKSKIEKQNQKEGLIGNLRDRIAEISKRVQALNKQSLKEKRDAWSESLNKLSQRLDGVSNISSEQSQEINQACDEIGKELSKIEEEVNSVQGLFPSTIINREPIKV
jgi:hypothetical protein